VVEGQNDQFDLEKKLSADYEKKKFVNYRENRKRVKFKFHKFIGP